MAYFLNYLTTSEIVITDKFLLTTELNLIAHAHQCTDIFKMTAMQFCGNTLHRFTTIECEEMNKFSAGYCTKVNSSDLVSTFDCLRCLYTVVLSQKMRFHCSGLILKVMEIVAGFYFSWV